MKHTADPSAIKKSIITFGVIAAVLFCVFFFVKSGFSIGRRGAYISLEGIAGIFGLICIVPIVFALMRRSPSSCVLSIQDGVVTYKNVELGWPLVQEYRFRLDEIHEVVVDDDEVKINLLPSSPLHKDDDDDDEPSFDIEIDASLFALDANNLAAALANG